MSKSAARDLVLDAGFSTFLGVRMVKTEKNLVVGEVHATEQHATSYGTRVHGGLLMAFADALGAAGAVLNLPSGYWTSTIESKTNFLAAAKFGWLRGEARPIHVGQTTQVWCTKISDYDGRLVATVTQTQLVLPVRPPSVKTQTGEALPSDLQESCPRSDSADSSDRV